MTRSAEPGLPSGPQQPKGRDQLILLLAAAILVSPLTVISVFNRGIDEGWWLSNTSGKLWCANGVPAETCRNARAAFDAGSPLQYHGYSGFREQATMTVDGVEYIMQGLPQNGGTWRLVATKPARGNGEKSPLLPAS